MSLTLLSVGKSDSPNAITVFVKAGKVTDKNGNPITGTYKSPQGSDEEVEFTADAAGCPDGQYNLMKDGRLYLISRIVDRKNPFMSIKRKLVSQNFNSLGLVTWPISLDNLKMAIGGEIDGEVVTREVKPFTIKSTRNGVTTERTVNRYSAVVFPHETVEGVFHNQGHLLLTGVTEGGTNIYEDSTVLPPRFQNMPLVVVEVDHELIPGEIND